jgi:hypothetical protein
MGFSYPGVVRFSFLFHALSMGAKSVRSHTPGSLFPIGQAAYVLVNLYSVGLSRPVSLARTAAWVRSETPSLARMCST